MGQQTLGLEGIITSWAGTNNGLILTALGEHKASLSIDGGVADRTQYTASLGNTAHGPGLRSWTVSISGRYLTSAVAQIGYAGSVAFSSALIYGLHIKSYNLSLEARVAEITEYGAAATAAFWKSFRPGLLSLSGSFDAFVDSSTAITNPLIPTDTIPTGTFTLRGDNTLACAVLTKQAMIDIPVGEANSAKYDFQGTGAITAAGTSNPMFAAGTVGLPDWDVSGTDGVPDTTLVFQAASGRTYTGAAFWSGISISHAPANYIDVTLNIRGTGALAIA